MRLRWTAGLALASWLVLGCTDPAPPTTGNLVVNVAGLPAGAPASVRLTRPDGVSLPVIGTTTFEQLEPGDYTLRATLVTFADAYYSSASEPQVYHVVAGRTETATVTYTLASGSLDVGVLGLDGVATPRLHLDGPSGRRDIGRGVVRLIPPGTYTLVADTTTLASGDLVAAPSQTVQVPASLTPVPVTVSFGLASGSLQLNVFGLPDVTSALPQITITGPGGYHQLWTGSTYRGLRAGAYTVDAARWMNCPDIYDAETPQQTVQVSVGSTASADVVYSVSPSGGATLDLKIDAMYLVQPVQTLDDDVPLVAGHRAMLRVFGSANQCNAAAPSVRVTLSTGDVYTLDRAVTGVPLSVDQRQFAQSWNVIIPAAKVQPGLTAVAEIDPGNTVPESDEGNNRFPASGALTPVVNSMPVMNVRFVPVTLAGSTGAVSSGNVDSFLSLARTIHPVSDYTAEVRATPYTTQHAALTSDDIQGWGAVLSEIEALRVAEGSPRYYSGIVHVGYTAGVAGIAYIAGRSSLVWDYLPTGAELFAHELGHNYGRLHAPCGNPAGPDPSYPYAGGSIGKVGYDLTTDEVKDPAVSTDIMGYCAHKWISDYTYTGMMNYLLNHPSSLQATVAGADEPALLVWGRIVDGVPVLEPAFEITTRAALPNAPGPNRLRLLGDDGSEIVAFSFAAQEIADLPGQQRAFAFAIPVSQLRGRTVASLRVDADRGSVTSVRGADVTSDASAVVTRVDSRAVRVRWDAARFPGLLVRDASTGEILTFARGGSALVMTHSDALELIYSNRVRSRSAQMRLK